MYQSDFDLLQRAAKGVGFDVEFGQLGREQHLFLRGQNNVWNPLIETGDTMRLALRLDELVEDGQFSATFSQETGYSESALPAARRKVVQAAADLYEQHSSPKLLDSRKSQQ